MIAMTNKARALAVLGQLELAFQHSEVPLPSRARSGRKASKRPPSTPRRVRYDVGRFPTGHAAERFAMVLYGAVVASGKHIPRWPDNDDTRLSERVPGAAITLHEMRFAVDRLKLRHPKQAKRLRTDLKYWRSQAKEGEAPEVIDQAPRRYVLESPLDGEREPVREGRQREVWERDRVVWFRPINAGEDEHRVEFGRGATAWVSLGRRDGARQGFWESINGISKAQRQLKMGGQWIDLPLVYTREEMAGEDIPAVPGGEGPAEGSDFAELLEGLRTRTIRTLRFPDTASTPHTLKVSRVLSHPGKVVVEGTVKKSKAKLTIQTEVDDKGRPTKYARMQRGSRGNRVDPKRISAPSRDASPIKEAPKAADALSLKGADYRRMAEELKAAGIEPLSGNVNWALTEIDLVHEAWREHLADGRDKPSAPRPEPRPANLSPLTAADMRMLDRLRPRIAGTPVDEVERAKVQALLDHGYLVVAGDRYELSSSAAEALLGVVPAAEQAADEASSSPPGRRETAHQRARRERAERKAAGLGRKASAQWESARAETAAIPMGQPILIGHHSERRHRKALDRQHKKAGRALETLRAAEAAESAAERAGYAISSDDPEAIPALKARLAELEESRELGKVINKAFRLGGWDAVEQVPGVTGPMLARARNLLKLAPWMKKPMDVTNIGANVRRVKKRIEELKARAERAPMSAIEGDGFTISEHPDDNRVRFTFAERPSKDVITDMKRVGFRWSRRHGAWQRQLNKAGRQTAHYMAKELFGWEGPDDDG